LKAKVVIVETDCAHHWKRRICVYACVCVCLWEKDIKSLNTLNGSIESKE